MTKDIWTTKKVLLWCSDYFTKHGIKTSRLDAEILLSKVLKTDRLNLYLNIEKPLNGEELASFRELIKLRVKRIPVSYITGKKEFWSLTFKVSPDALIPRPETEILIEKTLDIVKNNFKGRKICILDIGSGSGNIPVVLAKEIENSDVISIDFSKKALNLARENILEHNLEKKVNILCANLNNLIFKDNKFDIIVSNPPYIPTKDLKNLEPELSYEPKEALDGLDDGLFFIKEIVNRSHSLLKDTGYLLMEIGHDQSKQVRNIAGKVYKNENISFTKDYSGILRVFTAVKV